MGRIETISSKHHFIQTLCDALFAYAQAENPFAVSDITIYLPNRRAVHALQSALIAQNPQRAALMPQIHALGDDDSGSISLADLLDLPQQLSSPFDLSPFPAPAIDPTQRRLILARLVLAAGHDFASNFEQALSMADALARLLDQCHTEGLELDALDKLSELNPNLSEHWQQVLSFLDIIKLHWPQILDNLGLQDPSKRRHAMVIQKAAMLANNDRGQHIIIAGSTGSIPATRAMMKAVLSLKNGRIILPALDLQLDQDSWHAARSDVNHPQYGLANLLDELQVERDAVHQLGGAQHQCCSDERLQLVRDFMRPAACFHAQANGESKPQAYPNFSYLLAQNANHEAKTIALIIRYHLTRNLDQSIALVTPDRNLSRRVISELDNWNISADDSAGTPLRNSTHGIFMQHCATVIADNFAPTALLALLKHPYARMGERGSFIRTAVYQLERFVLRGRRPRQAGLQGLRAHWQQIKLQDDQDSQERQKSPRINPEIRAQIDTLLAKLSACAEHLSGINSSPERALPLPAALAAHLAFATALALDDEEHNVLFAGEEGKPLQQQIQSLLDQRSYLEPFTVALRDYPASFLSLVADINVRKIHKLQSRVFIWGSIEARLQRADVMILAGLNEGSWPTPTDIGPWMSRPMRQSFGLPLPERKIGLSAHDFSQGCCAHTVYLTRSARDQGTQTVPSRWIARLESLLQSQSENAAQQGLQAARDMSEILCPEQDFLAAALLPNIEIDSVPIARPAPCPALALRPRKLAITKIETWMNDPYAIYARYILGLKKLDDVDQEQNTADKGNLIHQAIEAFFTDFKPPFTEQSVTDLLALMHEKADAVIDSNISKAFWLPRLEHYARWIIQQEQKRDQAIQARYLEQSGELVLALDKPFTLTGKADRINLLNDGTLALIDYKTGANIAFKDIASGQKPQLTLEGLIAQKGGFNAIPAAFVSALEYWHVRGADEADSSNGCKINSVITDTKLNQDAITDAIAQAEQGLYALITAFDQPDQPYYVQPLAQNQQQLLTYNDYAHLERIQEWME